MKRLLTILFLSFIVNYSFAQVKVNSEGDIIPTGIYPAVKSNNLKGTIHQFKSIVDRNALPANFRDTGMIAYVRDSAKYYYLYNGITNADWRDLFKASSALTSGLTSTGDITLVDSTLTINDTIRYTINGVDYIQTIPSTFIVNSADSGYYRKDLIYADATGLYKVVGVPNMIFGVKPKLPINAIEITTVDIYGQQIATPVPVIITPVPNLLEVTNAGNSTTNPIFINSNSIQTPLRITSDFNRSNYLYFKNRSNGNWANTGFLFKNDITDDAGNEWSGHWFRLMQGSTNSDMIKDGAILMTNGSGGMKIVSDSGRITFNSGSPAYPYDTTSHPYKEMGAFETDGSFRLNKYKNNATLDSVLAPDENGLLVLKKVSVGDIDVLQNTIDSSSFGIKKLDGTVKNVVVYADGLTGVSGGGTQVNSDWNATSGVAEILNKPTIPAQFNPIAGTNMTITGTYPNITFNSTASGGSTYTASNGLTMVGNDVQLGGILSKSDTINSNGNELRFTYPSYSSYPLITKISARGIQISSNSLPLQINAYKTIAVVSTAIDSTSVPYSAVMDSLGDGDNVAIRMVGFAPTFKKGQEFSIEAFLPNQPGSSSKAVDIAFKTDKIFSNGNAASIHFRLRDSFTTTSPILDKFIINNTGQLQANNYGTGLFTGTPTYNLGVDASGNIIEVASPTVSTGTATPSSTPTKIGDIYIDTTAKKLYFASGTSSSADWIIAN